MISPRRHPVLCIIFGSAMIFGSLLAAGCSRDSEEPAWFQSSQSGAPLGPDAINQRIAGVDSLFLLVEMKRAYILRSGEPENEVIEALDRRRDQLVESAEAFPAIPGKLDFLGWRIRPAAEIPGREWSDNQGKYEISGYFVVTGEMDRDWIFRIMTKVDEQHVSHLPPDRREAGYLNWQIYPLTSTWDPGEHYVLSTVVDLAPVPYFIYARMYLYPEYINQGDFAYGWFADPDLEPVPRDRPAPR